MKKKSSPRPSKEKRFQYIKNVKEGTPPPLMPVVKLGPWFAPAVEKARKQFKKELAKGLAKQTSPKGGKKLAEYYMKTKPTAKGDILIHDAKAQYKPIKYKITIDTSQAVKQVKALQKQIDNLNKSIPEASKKLWNKFGK